MKVQKNASGLFVFPFDLHFRNTSRRFNAMVDSGSTICACTYKIPVAMRARQTNFAMVASPFGTKTPSPGYSLSFEFDGRSEMTTVYRLPITMPDIDYILGAPILSLCKVTMEQDCLDITWLPKHPPAPPAAAS